MSEQFQNIFKRHELKYMMTLSQKEEIVNLMKDYMTENQFFHSTICNLYYDTPDRYLVRRSLEHPDYKEKLRLRSYGVPKADSLVFPELKKKFDSIVYKRRIGMRNDIAEDWLRGKAECPTNTQIAREISYFLKFYDQIEPAVFLAYERDSYQGIEDPEFRVTFDMDITWRDEDLSLRKGIYGNRLLAPDLTLMEVKVGDSVPLWFTRMIRAVGANRTTFSKYGSVYMELMKEHIPDTRRIYA